MLLTELKYSYIADDVNVEIEVTGNENLDKGQELYTIDEAMTAMLSRRLRQEPIRL